MTPADDGPNEKYTEELLKGLEERGVTATFFLLGKEVEQSPGIVKEIKDGGHGTHSYDYVNLSNLTDAAVIEQVDKRTISYCCTMRRSPR